MIKENAVIVATSDDVAWVETQRQSTCSGCQVKKGCGTSTLQKVLGQKRTRLKALNPEGFLEGEKVTLGLQEGALVKGSFLLYSLPLLFMFGAALVGYFIFSLTGHEYTEGYRILFSIFGLASGFFFVYQFSGKMSSNPEYQAVILSRQDASYR